MKKLSNRHIRRLIPRTRKQWLLAGLGLIVALVAAYSAYSVLTWRSFAQQSTTVTEEVRKETQTAFTTVQSSEATLENKRQALETLATMSDAPCDPGVLVAWQEGLFGLVHHREACEASAAQRGAVTEAAAAIVRYFTSEQAIAKELAAVARDTKTASDKQWPQILASWQQAHDTIADLDVDSSFAPVKEAATKATAEVIAAWKPLIAAHEQKKQSEFRAAEEKLAKSYDGLSTIPVAGDNAIKPLLQNLARAQEGLK